MADLVRTDEQRMLAESVRAFLAAKGGTGPARALIDASAGPGDASWKHLARELGLTGFVIPERFGGSGFGFADLAVAVEEMGRAMYVGPFLSTSVVSTGALLAASAQGEADVAGELLPKIAGGELTLSLAAGGAAARGWPTGMGVRAESDGVGWTLSGSTEFVLDGGSTDRLLVYADSASGPTLFDVDAAAAGVQREAMRTLDLTRPQARIRLVDAPARVVGIPGEGRTITEHALRLGTVALAAEQVGGAQRCLDMSVEYARTRTQFGRPIGSFQAIKHKCADMLLQVESARSAARHAARVVDEDDRGALGGAAALAGAYCSETYFRVAAENVQIHGGIGFTWEHDAQLYYRRAKGDEVLFGTPRDHRRTLARVLGLATS